MNAHEPRETRDAWFFHRMKWLRQIVVEAGAGPDTLTELDAIGAMAFGQLLYTHLAKPDLDLESFRATGADGKERVVVDVETARHVERAARAAGPRLVFRPLLVSGMVGDTSDGKLILIDSEQPSAQQVVAIWHETVHLLLLAAGKVRPEEHDEATIDAIAHRLAVACPEIIDLVGVA